jgi:hypothetical protein
VADRAAIQLSRSNYFELMSAIAGEAEPLRLGAKLAEENVMENIGVHTSVAATCCSQPSSC